MSDPDLNSFERKLVPPEFYLGQNYPNPFSEKTTIKYCVAYKTRVQITVYDSDGKVIEKLVDEEKKPGTYEVEFNATSCHSGLPPERDGESANGEQKLAQGYYYYKMIAGDFTSEKKWLCINKLSGRLNMKNLLQTLFSFLLVTQIGFAQWYQQNSGTTKNLNAVQFIDTNNGFAVGDSGIILHTSNAGVVWVEQTSGTTNHLYEVSFIDANTGYAVGDSGTILKTDDGGLGWFLQSTGKEYALNSVCFVDAVTGWAVGDHWYWSPTSSDYSSVILRTTNGGAYWTQQTFTDTTRLNGVHFTDVNNGWAVGWRWSPNYEGNILRTTNGGTNWTSQTSGTDRVLYDVEFIDANIGWVVGGAIGPLPLAKKSQPTGDGPGIVLKTIDGGITWITQMDTVREALFGVSFVDNSFGYAVGFSKAQCSGCLWGVVVNTTDGGVNWTSQMNEHLSRFCNVGFIDANTGWVVGEDVDWDSVLGYTYNGLILHTTNGGVSFIEEEQVDQIPTEFLLSQNFPNPFNPTTSIQYAVSNRQFVSLKVYDVLGNEIETLVNEEKQAGTHEVTWYAEQLPSGVYFYQLRSENFLETKKMLLLK